MYISVLAIYIYMAPLVKEVCIQQAHWYMYTSFTSGAIYIASTLVYVHLLHQWCHIYSKHTGICTPPSLVVSYIQQAHWYMHTSFTSGAIYIASTLVYAHLLHQWCHIYSKHTGICTPPSLVVPYIQQAHWYMYTSFTSGAIYIASTLVYVHLLHQWCHIYSKYTGICTPPSLVVSYIQQAHWYMYTSFTSGAIYIASTLVYVHLLHQWCHIYSKHTGICTPPSLVVPYIQQVHWYMYTSFTSGVIYIASTLVYVHLLHQWCHIYIASTLVYVHLLHQWCHIYSKHTGICTLPSLVVPYIQQAHWYMYTSFTSGAIYIASTLVYVHLLHQWCHIYIASTLVYVHLLHQWCHIYSKHTGICTPPSLVVPYIQQAHWYMYTSFTSGIIYISSTLVYVHFLHQWCHIYSKHTSICTPPSLVVPYIYSKHTGICTTSFTSGVIYIASTLVYVHLPSLVVPYIQQAHWYMYTSFTSGAIYIASTLVYVHLLHQWCHIYSKHTGICTLPSLVVSYIQQAHWYMYTSFTSGAIYIASTLVYVHLLHQWCHIYIASTLVYAHLLHQWCHIYSKHTGICTLPSLVVPYIQQAHWYMYTSFTSGVIYIASTLVYVHLLQQWCHIYSKHTGICTPPSLVVPYIQQARWYMYTSFTSGVIYIASTLVYVHFLHQWCPYIQQVHWYMHTSFTSGAIYIQQAHWYMYTSFTSGTIYIASTLVYVHFLHQWCHIYSKHTGICTPPSLVVSYIQQAHWYMYTSFTSGAIYIASTLVYVHLLHQWCHIYSKHTGICTLPSLVVSYIYSKHTGICTLLSLVVPYIQQAHWYMYTSFTSGAIYIASTLVYVHLLHQWCHIYSKHTGICTPPSLVVPYIQQAHWYMYTSFTSGAIYIASTLVYVHLLHQWCHIYSKHTGICTPPSLVVPYIQQAHWYMYTSFTSGAIYIASTLVQWCHIYSKHTGICTLPSLVVPYIQQAHWYMYTSFTSGAIYIASTLVYVHLPSLVVSYIQQAHWYMYTSFTSGAIYIASTLVYVHLLHQWCHIYSKHTGICTPSFTSGAIYIASTLVYVHFLHQWCHIYSKHTGICTLPSLVVPYIQQAHWYMYTSFTSGAIYIASTLVYVHLPSLVVPYIQQAHWYMYTSFTSGAIYIASTLVYVHLLHQWCHIYSKHTGICTPPSLVVPYIQQAHWYMYTSFTSGAIYIASTLVYVHFLHQWCHIYSKHTGICTPPSLVVPYIQQAHWYMYTSFTSGAIYIASTLVYVHLLHQWCPYIQQAHWYMYTSFTSGAIYIASTLVYVHLLHQWCHIYSKHTGICTLPSLVVPYIQQAHWYMYTSFTSGAIYIASTLVYVHLLHQWCHIYSKHTGICTPPSLVVPYIQQVVYVHFLHQWCHIYSKHTGICTPPSLVVPYIQQAHWYMYTSFTSGAIYIASTLVYAHLLHQWCHIYSKHTGICTPPSLVVPYIQQAHWYMYTSFNQWCHI